MQTNATVAAHSLKKRKSDLIKMSHVEYGKLIFTEMVEFVGLIRDFTKDFPKDRKAQFDLFTTKIMDSTKLCAAVSTDLINTLKSEIFFFNTVQLSMLIATFQPLFIR